MKSAVINIRASKIIPGLVKVLVTSPAMLMKFFLNVEACITTLSNGSLVFRSAFFSQIVEEFDLDVTSLEIDTYLREVVVPRGIMAHQVPPKEISDNPLLNAMATAMQTIAKKDVSLHP